jgi:B-cell receptor-associated protein 31
MVVFVGLIIPLPYKIKRKLFTFISESPLVAKVQYAMKVGCPHSPAENLELMCVCVFVCVETQITFIFILILFLDSVNRVYRVQVELAAYSKDGSGAG